MTLISELLAGLEVPQFVTDIREGRIKPITEFYKPIQNQGGYPPCVIPLYEYGTDLAYCGILKHWFCNRKTVFVNLATYMNFYVYEHSRTSEQFAVTTVIQAFEHEESLSKKVRNFAASVGVSNVADIFKIWQDLEDGCYDVLECFKSDWPNSSDFDERVYEGDFSSQYMNQSEQNLRRYCSIEICEQEFETEVLDKRKATIPPWFDEREQSDIFESSFERGDLLGCWMSINSRGWEWSGMRDALGKLAESVSDPVFQKQCELWQSANHEEASGKF